VHVSFIPIPTGNDQFMKLNASEGNEPLKASSPLPFREAK